MKTILVCLVLGIVGCGDAAHREVSKNEQLEAAQQRDNQFLTNSLPPDAKIIERLGSDFYVVEFKVLGEPKQYLYKYWWWNGTFHITLEPLEKRNET